ncbi:MAG: hypothetical protein RIS14_1465 [Pseudomonadota bacterium]
MHIFSSTPLLPALMTALGIGLMIGMVRERTHLETFAGVRTHALTALAAVLSTSLGTGPFLILLGLVLVLVSLAYWRSAAQDAGMTGEVALMVTALLGSLAVTQTALAAGLGALAAVLLYAKTPLHRFAKEVLSEREVHDGIILLASALIVLPLPAKLWRLVVLVMLVGAIAHVALRLVGNRWGLPLAGFFSGYVSSTAATLSSAGTARAEPELKSPALAAALLANVASLSLFIPILLAMAPAYLRAIRFELAAAIAVLVLLSVFGLRYSRDAITESSVAQKRMFRIQHALALVAIIAAILFLTAYLNEVLGSEWAVALALFASAAELHAALVGVAELSKAGALPHPEWGFFGLLLVSFTVKTGIAWYAGGRDFAWRFGAAMLTALGVVAAVILLRG